MVNNIRVGNLRNDTGYGAIFPDGRQQKNRDRSLLGEGGAAADAIDDGSAIDMAGVDVPEQVDFQACVYG